MIEATEERAKEFFEYTNRNWPEPKIAWESLPEAAKHLWRQRAAKHKTTERKEHD